MHTHTYTRRAETVIDRVDEWLRRQTFAGMVDRHEIKKLLTDVVSDDDYWQRQVGLWNQHTCA